MQGKFGGDIGIDADFKKQVTEKKTFILMRFYNGGGLADYDFVTCEEDKLYDYCVKFEQECVRRNLGTRCGILEKEELEKITKNLKED